MFTRAHNFSLGSLLLSRGGTAVNHGRRRCELITSCTVDDNNVAARIGTLLMRTDVISGGALNRAAATRLPALTDKLLPLLAEKNSLNLVRNYRLARRLSPRSPLPPLPATPPPRGLRVIHHAAQAGLRRSQIGGQREEAGIMPGWGRRNEQGERSLVIPGGEVVTLGFCAPRLKGRQRV